MAAAGIADISLVTTPTSGTAITYSARNYLNETDAPPANSIPAVVVGSAFVAANSGDILHLQNNSGSTQTFTSFTATATEPHVVITYAAADVAPTASLVDVILNRLSSRMFLNAIEHSTRILYLFYNNI